MLCEAGQVVGVFEKTGSCKKGIHFGFLEWTLAVTFLPSNNRSKAVALGQVGRSHSRLNAGFGADVWLVPVLACLQCYRGSGSESRDWVMKWSWE